MNSEKDLRKALDILEFEKEIAEVDNNSALAFRLEFSIKWLKKGLMEFNKKPDFDILEELNNLGVGMATEELTNPYSNLQERASKPLQLALNAQTGIYEEVVPPKLPTAKERVAKYLNTTTQNEKIQSN